MMSCSPSHCERGAGRLLRQTRGVQRALSILVPEALETPWTISPIPHSDYKEGKPRLCPQFVAPACFERFPNSALTPLWLPTRFHPSTTSRMKLVLFHSSFWIMECVPTLQRRTMLMVDGLVSFTLERLIAQDAIILLSKGTR